MKPTLSKEESEQYITVVTKGNKDDMFDFGYTLGRESVSQRNDARPTETHRRV